MNCCRINQPMISNLDFGLRTAIQVLTENRYIDLSLCRCPYDSTPFSMSAILSAVNA